MFPGFNIEIENNSIISRTAIFVKNTVKYERRCEFEGIDSNLTIIDVKGKETVRIINLYRSFAPTNGRTVRENFTYQLELIRLAWMPGTILLGDFNLKWVKRFDHRYQCKQYFEEFERVLGHLALFQLMEEITIIL